MGLTEDHLLIRTVNRPPAANAALHRPANTFSKTGMAPQYLLINRHRA